MTEPEVYNGFQDDDGCPDDKFGQLDFDRDACT